MAGRGSKPGERRGGRQKGTPNKITTDMRQAIVEAFEKKGGVKWLEGLDDKTFSMLAAKVIPNENINKNYDMTAVSNRLQEARERLANENAQPVKKAKSA